MKQEKRDYYVSKEIIEKLTLDYASVDCCVHGKNSLGVTELTVGIEQTGSERGRHDLSILYKTAYISGHTFQLSFDFVDCGAGGLDYGKGEELKLADRRKLYKNNCVLIYDTSEAKDSDTIFFKVNVLADDTGVASELDAVTSKVDIEAVVKGLQDGTVIILPVTKDDKAYEGVVWSKSSEDVFTFHSRYIPTFYTNVTHILNAKVTVPKDFVLYDFFVMNKKVAVDTLGNSWVSLSYDCCLNTLDLLELDNTGKAHMYVLDNFKDIDKQSIYESFMNLNKESIAFETMLRVVEKVQPLSTKWLEDYIVEKIKSREDYYLSDYIDTIVKYVRVVKKSKDKDVERFIDMMLHYGGYAHIDGYVRILKAMKLKDTELAEYVQRIITADKQSNRAGYYAACFISNWKTESFKELEDYIYEGIKTQEIYEPCSSSSFYRKTDEEKQRRGLNTDYDFVTNYMKLLRVKGVNKVDIIKRYALGVAVDSEHFPISVLLARLEEYIRHEEKEDTSEAVALFVQYIVDYDTYGKYAKRYIPEEKQRELGMSYSSYTYYTSVFEPYIETLSEVYIEGKKKEEAKEREERTKRLEAEWAEKRKKRDAEIAARFKE